MAYTDIDDPTIYFTTNLRSGLYGGSDTAFDIGFQPDWIWNKKRSGTGVHSLFDSVRGFGSSGKVLYSNTDGAEATNALIKSVSSTGYTITASSDDTGTMVDWSWKETATAGFDIVSYTGTGSARTISHNLSAVPKWIICKSRSDATRWDVYHVSIGATKHMRLNTTDAERTSSAVFNNTEPTSSVFSLGNGAAVNASSETFIAYLFSEIKGYSKFGSYTGNGSTDGTFVYTGFKPAFLIIKITNSADSWRLFDNKRNTYNPVDITQRPNTNNADYGPDAANNVDFLSNGFKFRTTSGGYNGSGDTHIFMAFAESPFVTGSSAVPTTAR